jgi:hypothetical protein
MLGRKMFLLKKAGFPKEPAEKFIVRAVNWDEVKNTISRNLKKYGQIIIFVSLRIYILSVHNLKQHYFRLAEKIKKIIRQNFQRADKDPLEKQEVSKFLKVVSEYRQKIKKMKRRIKAEEGIE